MKKQNNQVEERIDAAKNYIESSLKYKRQVQKIQKRRPRKKNPLGKIIKKNV